jgi:uncharacterized protein (DUF433 family)
MKAKLKKAFIKEIMMSTLIISNPKIMMGKPVIKGTRITVELILEKLSSGESVDQILDEHPRLTREAIQASCAFAAEALKADVVYPADEATV